MPDLIIIADRVLVVPDDGEEQTESGLVLPASVKDRERVQTGRVVQVGPGYVMPNPEYSEGELWKQQAEAVRYLPLQARPGDRAFFLRKEAIEITYDGTRYLILPHAALLALLRPDTADELDNLDDWSDR